MELEIVNLEDFEHLDECLQKDLESICKSLSDNMLVIRIRKNS